MSVKNIVIVGAGQLGSRHLQGLKKAQVPMRIFVVDASDNSLQICEQRYNEVPENQLVESICFATSLQGIPEKIDFAIVATGSKPRAAIIQELVEKHKCQRLILEKFLFPKMADYEEISALFKHNDVRAWVNCSRRYFTCYQNLRQLLLNDGPIDFKLEGKNWGLCCNSIHQIDLFAFLSGESDISFDCSQIDPVIYESKRSGYIEMTGTILGKTEKGSSLQISSYEQYDETGRCVITSQHHKVEISEAVQKMTVDGREEEMVLLYQSEMTGRYIEEFVTSDELPLAKFEESAKLHQQILPHFLNIYNKIKGLQSDLCPIT